MIDDLKEREVWLVGLSLSAVVIYNDLVREALENWSIGQRTMLFVAMIVFIYAYINAGDS